MPYKNPKDRKKQVNAPVGSATFERRMERQRARRKMDREGVGFFVESSFLFKFTQDCLDAGFVSFVGCFCPTIILNSEFFPQTDESLCVPLG